MSCSLIFRPIDEASACAILKWRYPVPYDVYNIEVDDPQEAVRFFLNAQNAYYMITHGCDDLQAFCCLGRDAQVPGGDYRVDALDIGLGLRPDLTGQGNGLMYVNAVLDFACHTFMPATVRVTVAAFNKRALRVWERAGFNPVETFHSASDSRPFVILVRNL